MATSVRIARAAAITGGGPTQDFTVAGWGVTPKAALFVVTSATNGSGTPADEGIISWGVADASSEGVFTIHDTHGQTPSDSYRRGTTDEVIMVGTGIDGEANFDSFISNGVRVSWGVLPSVAYQVTVWLFAGDDLSVDVGNFSSNTTQNASVDVDCGFEPDVVLGCLTGGGLNDSGANDAICSLGLAGNGAGGITQRAIVVSSDDSNNPSDCEQAFYTTRWLINPSQSGGISRALEVTDFLNTGEGDSVSGFQVTTRDGQFSLSVLYLALKFGGGEGHYVGTLAAPTGTGNDANTDPGFTTQAVMLLPSLVTSAGSFATSSVFTLGVCGFTASEEYSAVITCEDASAPTDTQGLADALAVHVPQHDGADEMKAAFVSMDGSGYTLNWTDVLGSAYLFAVLAIEAAAAGGITETTNQASETGVAQALGGPAKAKTLGMVTESSSVQAIGSAKTLAVGHSSETDTAQATTFISGGVLGLATETNTALAQTSLKTKAVSSATETGLAQSVPWAPKIRVTGQVTETSTVQSFDRLKTREVSQLHEGTAALAFAASMAKTVSLVAETNQAQVIVSPKSKAISLATETNLAQAIGTAKQLSIGITTQSELAQSVGRLKAVSVGLTTEASTAQAIEFTGQITATVNLVTETDLAQSTTWAPKIRIAAGVTESNTLQSLAIAKASALGLTAETELAQAVTSLTATVLHEATGTEIAQALGTAKARATTEVTETSVVQAILAGKATAITLVSEAEIAQTLGPLKLLAIGEAVESESAFEFSLAGVLAYDIVRFRTGSESMAGPTLDSEAMI